MSAVPRHLADTLARDGAALHMDRHVGYLHAATGQTWAIRHLPAASVRPGTVTDAGGDLAEGFDAILLALPAPQAIPLLAAIGHDHADALSGVTFAPCWAIMAAFADRIDSPDTARPHAGPLGWVAREGSRPGHATSPDAWVLHASPAWSRAHLERAAEDVAMELAETFAPGRPPLHLHAHRWRYALVETPLGIPCLWDARTRVGVCGDFCLGARVEAAWLSGTALAAAVLAQGRLA
jgi:predicted NAD/FAD-dependent oxidoreductase